MSATFRAGGVIVTVLLTFTLIGCTDPSEKPSVVGSDAPVIVPSGPGAPGRTASPGETLGPVTGTPQAADVRFAEAMIPHHRQALEMTAMVEARTTSPSIRQVAQQITIAQQPEIRVMSNWLRALGRAVPEHHADGGAGGYGMMTLEELNSLRGARGAEFDRLFLRLMIRHHEGAMRMAAEELTAGGDQRMRLMAKDVHSGQGIEIARMRELL